MGERKRLAAHVFLPVRWLQGGKGPKHAKVETMEGLVGKGLLGSNSHVQFKLEPTSLCMLQEFAPARGLCRRLTREQHQQKSVRCSDA